MKRLLPFLILLCCATFSFALTAADVLTRARLTLRDTSSDVVRQRFSDAQLLNWLNDGQREANANNLILQSSSTITLVAGTTEYVLPLDFLTTWRVTLNNIKLPQTNWNEQDANSVGWQKSSNGIPLRYYIYYAPTPTIGFIPAPSSTYVTQSMPTAKVWYIQQSVDLTSVSQVPYNGWVQLQPYISDLSYYVTYRGLWAIGDMDQAQQYFLEWQASLGTMKTSIGKQPDFNPGFGGNRTGP